MSVTESDTDEEEGLQLVRMVRTYRTEGPLRLEFTRFIPQLTKDFLSDDILFKQKFGLHHSEFEELHSMVEHKILRNRSSFDDNIGSRERLAICLRFLASGESMEVLSGEYDIPQSCVPTIVRETCRCVCRCMVPVVMPNPSADMWEKNATDFGRISNMPSCIGALEGKNLVVNKQKVVLLALVDARDRFIMVDVGHYRMNSSRGNVIDRSCLGRAFQNNDFNVPYPRPITANSEPVPFVILASSFFPPKPYLLTKYSRAECDVNDTNRVFNTRVSRAKVTVNRALMRLRSRWCVFQGPLELPLPVVRNIVVACCCLHNFFGLRHSAKHLEYPTRAVAITEDRYNALLQLLPKHSRDVRDRFKAYFMSAEGQVPWQWQDIVE